MKSLTITLSKTELEKGPDGKWYYKELARTETGRDERLPDFWDRLIELRHSGQTYAECADTLNAEGFKAKQGGPIRQTTLIVLYHYHTVQKLKKEGSK